MKSISKERPSSQGDLMIRFIGETKDCIPKSVKLVEKNELQILEHSDDLIVAHSETGHHHVMESITESGLQLFRGENPFISYLVVNKPTKLVHKRSFDTHETFDVPPGVFELRRQREAIPNSWDEEIKERMVQD